jgi:tRNA pseudouridine13 synthase
VSSQEITKVHEPPIQTGDLPGTGGAIGAEPEAFVVDEVPLYPASGEGEHRYVLIKKRGRSTPDMVREIARASGVDERNIGYAGMKDKHAVTTQWLSLPVKTSDPETWRLPEGIWVQSVTRHNNKLRTGHLLANRFAIRLERCQAGAFEKAKAIQARVEASGLVNYFGAQRFGERSENLERALGWLREGASLRRVGRFLAKLYPSVIQSELFNRYATQRIALGLDRLITGEIVRLEGAGAMFCVENPEAELGRLHASDIHLTGPIVGPRARQAAGQALELETAVQTELGLTERDLQALGRAAPGTRRDLLIRIEDLDVTEGEADSLLLTFTLPAGSYATQLIREFTRSAFLPDERPPQAV